MTLDASRYDAEINDGGTLYNLIYAENSPAQTELLPLQATKIDTGNPNEMRPETGYFFSQNDFSGGLGQGKFHAPGSDPTAYLYGQGIEVDDEGRVEIAPEPAAISGFTTVLDPYNRLVAADSVLFGIAAGAGGVRRTGDLSTVATESVGGEAVVDIDARGGDLFAGVTDTATPLYLRPASTDTWGAYQVSAANVTFDSATRWATRVRWLKDRLWVAAQKTSNPDFLYVVDGSTATPSTVDEYPAGSLVLDIWESGGFVYTLVAMAINGRNPTIYCYGLNSAGTDMERKHVQKFEHGEYLCRGLAYGGFVWLAGSPGVGGTLVYQAIPDATGSLTWLLAYRSQAGGQAGVRSLFAYEGKLYIGTSHDEGSETYGLSSDQDNGILTLDVATGAVHQLGGLVGDAAIQEITAVSVFNGTIVFAAKGSSSAQVYTQGTARSYSGSSIGSAPILITSVADFNNAGMKLWDEIRITHDPLPAGSSIQVQYSTKHPEENDWTTAGTSSTTDAEGKTFNLSNVKSRTLALRFNFTRGTDTTTSPKLINYTVRAFPCAEQTSDIEWRFARDVRIIKGDRKPHNRPDHSTTGPWGGDTHARRKALMDLAYKKVTLTEPDATWSVRVVGIADVEPMQPIVTSTETDEAYVMRLTFEGRRTA